MDREKVIKGLECLAQKQVPTANPCKDCAYIDRINFAVCVKDIASDALILLKEQEAKPVIVATNAYGTRFYHCPRCNRDLYIYPRQLYCSNCGQAVKWND